MGQIKLGAGPGGVPDLGPFTQERVALTKEACETLRCPACLGSFEWGPTYPVHNGVAFHEQCHQVQNIETAAGGRIVICPGQDLVTLTAEDCRRIHCPGCGLRFMAGSTVPVVKGVPTHGSCIGRSPLDKHAMTRIGQALGALGENNSPDMLECTADFLERLVDQQTRSDLVLYGPEAREDLCELLEVRPSELATMPLDELRDRVRRVEVLQHPLRRTVYQGGQIVSDEILRCTCDEIQRRDARRHFKGCALREPLPEHDQAAIDLEERLPLVSTSALREDLVRRSEACEAVRDYPRARAFSRAAEFLLSIEHGPEDVLRNVDQAMAPRSSVPGEAVVRCRCGVDVHFVQCPGRVFCNHCGIKIWEDGRFQV